MNRIDVLNKLLEVFFAHQIKLKMYHFQTKNYGAHKASDKYLEKFDANFDRFMEVAQGLYSKVTNTNLNFNIKMVTDSTINQEIENFANVLNNDVSFYKQNSDLLAIRDEMLADVNQLKYLLTFE